MNQPRDLSSIDEILDFAIEKEQEAADFYTEWAGRVKETAIGEILAGFSAEEKKHKAFIQDIKAGKKVSPKPKEVMDLSISDYLVDVSPTQDMDYQNALRVAMQREKAAFRLYTNLAARVDDTGVKDLFHTLAQEEAKHKLRLETIYDDEILTEN